MWAEQPWARWEPYGGRDGRWLLLGFRTPVFATRVAVYESHAYGSVQQLLLLDEDNGYHAILDQEQGDRDLADCLRSPLLVSFPPTQRRIVALWLLVGVGAVESTHDSRSRRSNHPSAAHIDEARLAQIDAAQLFSTPPPTGSGGPLLRASSMLAGPRDSNAVPSASRVIALARAVG